MFISPLSYLTVNPIPKLMNLTTVMLLVKPLMKKTSLPVKTLPPLSNLWRVKTLTKKPRNKKKKTLPCCKTMYPV